MEEDPGWGRPRRAGLASYEGEPSILEEVFGEGQVDMRVLHRQPQASEGEEGAAGAQRRPCDPHPIPGVTFIHACDARAERKSALSRVEAFAGSPLVLRPQKRGESVEIASNEINPVLESLEIAREEPMDDGVPGRVEVKVFLGDIGRVIPRVHEDVIPGAATRAPIPARTVQRRPLAPMSRVDIHDHSPIAKQGMLDHIADPKSSAL